MFICLAHCKRSTRANDRVDPTEFQSLKDEIEILKAEKFAWETERATHFSDSTEQQETVVIATFSFTAETYEEDCIDCRFEEDEQGAEGCYRQEQPDLLATNSALGAKNIQLKTILEPAHKLFKHKYTKSQSG